MPGSLGCELAGRQYISPHRPFVVILTLDDLPTREEVGVNLQVMCQAKNSALDVIVYRESMMVESPSRVT